MQAPTRRARPRIGVAPANSGAGPAQSNARPAAQERCAEASAWLQWSFGEVRPGEFKVAFARAAALAGQTPDPQLAALIALAAVVCCPRYIRELDHGTVAADGRRLCGPGGLCAIPPELRGLIATHHQHLSAYAQRRSIAMLPGSSHGRMSQAAIRRALAELDAPASLRHDPSGRTIGERANADGPHAPAHAHRLDPSGSRLTTRRAKRTECPVSLLSDRVGKCR